MRRRPVRRFEVLRVHPPVTRPAALFHTPFEKWPPRVDELHSVGFCTVQSAHKPYRAPGGALRMPSCFVASTQTEGSPRTQDLVWLLKRASGPRVGLPGPVLGQSWFLKLMGTDRNPVPACPGRRPGWILARSHKLYGQNRARKPGPGTVSTTEHRFVNEP